ncbi:MAG: AAA family ATPase [Chloroflexota bacterium]
MTDDRDGLPPTEPLDAGAELSESTDDPNEREIFLRVTEALPFDIHRGIARIDQDALDALNLTPGSLVHVNGKRRTTLRVELSPPGLPERHVIRMDGTLRDNVQAGLDDRVRVRSGGAVDAQSIEIRAADGTAIQPDEIPIIRAFLSGQVLTPGDRVVVTALARGQTLIQMVESEPSGPVVVHLETVVRTQAPGTPKAKGNRQSVRYEDIGGLERELTRVREQIELPMKFPDLFGMLRIEPPKGVLLYGPPGTGKTLIARAVATEVEAAFIHVNGPEIMQKYVGESEARLREVFEQAQRDAPSIIFLDEIDAIAPKRADVVGEVEKRVVAQLLTLMDGLVSRGQVTVIGATNMPQLVDPALRRPGRFDREIAVNAPSKTGRLQILSIHSRGLPLAEDVDLDRLAEITHGFVGADLEVLCKEAGMLALRDVLDSADLDTADPTTLANDAMIRERHFLTALKGIEPTATRELLIEKPNVPWTQVGGLHDVRRTLEEAIEYPRKYPHLFQEAGIKPPRGILLSGASGTGKSLLARAAATSVGLSLITADAASLLSKWLGESEKAIRQVFSRARQAAPCVLFLDELDAIAPARGGDQVAGAVDRIVSQLISELDSLEEHSEVIVLAATNRLDLIDPALLSPRRFGTVLELPMPGEHDRREILDTFAREMPLGDDVDLRLLAAESDGLSGADLSSLCQRAAMQAIRDAIEAERDGAARPAGKLMVRAEHFEVALADARQRLARHETAEIVRLTRGSPSYSRAARPDAR